VRLADVVFCTCRDAGAALPVACIGIMGANLD
jgi:hypothetical protein